MEYNVNSKGGLATKGQNCLDHVNACNLFDAGKNSNSHLGDYTPHIESSLFLLFYFVFDLRKFPPKTWIRCPVGANAGPQWHGLWHYWATCGSHKKTSSLDRRKMTPKLLFITPAPLDSYLLHQNPHSGAINTISVLQGEPSIYSGMNELSLQIEEHAFSMLTNAAPIIDRVQII